jgi:hypothetical protein
MKKITEEHKYISTADIEKAMKITLEQFKTGEWPNDKWIDISNKSSLNLWSFSDRLYSDLHNVRNGKAQPFEVVELLNVPAVEVDIWTGVD